jgi:hypothetical protein
MPLGGLRSMNLDDRVVAALEKKRARLWKRLERRGGRGVELANEIDRLDCAIDALKGELYCPHCEARLTGERKTERR